MHTTFRPRRALLRRSWDFTGHPLQAGYGNARLFERMKRRAAQLQQDMERDRSVHASASDGGDNAR